MSNKHDELENTVAEALAEALAKAVPWASPGILDRAVAAGSAAALGELHMNVELRKQSLPPGLMSMPAEIRNRIFELALIKYEPTTTGTASSTSSTAGAKEYEQGPIREAYDLRQPSLTRVCRQLRRETLPIFYGANTFRCLFYKESGACFETWPLRRTMLYRCLRAIGTENRRLVRSVVLDVAGEWDNASRSGTQAEFESLVGIGEGVVNVVEHGDLTDEDGWVEVYPVG